MSGNVELDSTVTDGLDRDRTLPATEQLAAVASQPHPLP